MSYDLIQFLEQGATMLTMIFHTKSISIESIAKASNVKTNKHLWPHIGTPNRIMEVIPLFYLTNL